MVFLIYLLFLMTYIMLSKRKLTLLFPVIMIAAIIFGLNTYHYYSILNQKKLVVYSIKKHSAYDFILGDQHVLLTDSTLTQEKHKIENKGPSIRLADAVKSFKKAKGKNAFKKKGFWWYTESISIKNVFDLVKKSGKEMGASGKIIVTG